MNQESDSVDIATGLCRCSCGNELEEKPPKTEKDKESSSSSEGSKGTKCYCCIQDIDEKDIKDLSLKEYLQDIVSPLILDGFQAVLQKIPPNPIPFLKDYYLKESDNSKKDIPKHL